MKEHNNIRTYIWKHMYVRTIFPYVWFKLSNKRMFIIYCTCLFLSNLISLRVCPIKMIRITYVLKSMYVRIISYSLINFVTNQYVYNLKYILSHEFYNSRADFCTNFLQQKYSLIILFDTDCFSWIEFISIYLLTDRIR